MVDERVLQKSSEIAVRTPMLQACNHNDKFDRDDLVVSHPHFNCREDTEVLFRQVTQHFDVQFHDDIVAAVH